MCLMLISALAWWGVFAAPAVAGKRSRAKRAVSKAVPSVPVDQGTAGSIPAPRLSASTTNASASPATATAGATTTAAAPGKPRVYTFGGLDVSGNLRAPQMLFFRGRVQQELDTSSPQKRSFLKELERTADAKGL